MNLSILQKIIASTTCSGISLIVIVVPLLTINRSTELEEDENNEDYQQPEPDHVYFYVQGQTSTNTRLKTDEIYQENKNFKCRYNGQIFDCEISFVKKNNKKWHLAKKIHTLTNKPKTADLKNPTNIFQIKFDKSFWSKIEEKRANKWVDIVNKTKNTEEYAYLKPLFATYQGSRKFHFDHFVAQLVSVKGNVDLSEAGFKCKFDNNSSANNGVVCDVNSFNNENEILNSTTYKEAKSFALDTKTKSWQQENIYLISFKDNEKLTHSATHIHYFKGDDKTKALEFEIINKKIFFDKEISDHIFIL